MSWCTGKEYQKECFSIIIGEEYRRLFIAATRHVVRCPGILDTEGSRHA